MCNFLDNCCFLTIINDTYKNVQTFIGSAKRKFSLNFNYKLIRKNRKYQ